VKTGKIKIHTAEPVDFSWTLTVMFNKWRRIVTDHLPARTEEAGPLNQYFWRCRIIRVTDAGPVKIAEM
jgi:hypothetical protein